MSYGKVVLLLKTIAVFILGLVFPVIIIFQSYMGLISLSNEYGNMTSANLLIEDVAKFKQNIKSDNDYRFVSLLYLEDKNYAVMVRKQVMKITIMQIGYATRSIGLMLIVLGFRDKEHNLAGSWDNIKLDFKTGSTGALVVVIGAIMATLGGVLKNDYNNNAIPAYQRQVYADDVVSDIYKGCIENAGEKAADCFLKSYEHAFSTR